MRKIRNATSWLEIVKQWTYGKLNLFCNLTNQTLLKFLLEIMDAASSRLKRKGYTWPSAHSPKANICDDGMVSHTCEGTINP